jgi:hypothetical protein
MLEPRLGVRIATERGRAVIARRHRLLQAAQFILRRDEVGRAGQCVLAE